MGGSGNQHFGHAPEGGRESTLVHHGGPSHSHFFAGSPRTSVDGTSSTSPGGFSAASTGAQYRRTSPISTRRDLGFTRVSRAVGILAPG
jgi:hypothetical protein